jgi:hypothetical protein
MTEGWKASVASIIGSPLSLRVTKIEWYNPVAQGDTVTIIDPGDGHDLVDFTCEVAGQSQIIDWNANPILWRDFEVSQISSGTLKIWVKY